MSSLLLTWQIVMRMANKLHSTETFVHTYGIRGNTTFSSGRADSGLPPLILDSWVMVLGVPRSVNMLQHASEWTQATSLHKSPHEANLTTE